MQGHELQARIQLRRIRTWKDRFEGVNHDLTECESRTTFRIFKSTPHSQYHLNACSFFIAFEMLHWLLSARYLTGMILLWLNFPNCACISEITCSIFLISNFQCIWNKGRMSCQVEHRYQLFHERHSRSSSDARWEALWWMSLQWLIVSLVWEIEMG